MIVIGACGRACEKCPFFGQECEGCREEMKYSSRYRCKVYDCVIARGLQSCLECGDYDECSIVREYQALCPLVVLKVTHKAFDRDAKQETSAH